METRTGMMPVCGAILLCVLTILSIRAWQGADLAAEFRGLTYFSTAPRDIDSEIAQLKNDLQTNLGLASKDKTFESGNLLSSTNELSQVLSYDDDWNRLTIGSNNLKQLVESRHQILMSRSSDDSDFEDEISTDFDNDFDSWFDQMANILPEATTDSRGVNDGQFISTSNRVKASVGDITAPNRPNFEPEDSVYVEPVSGAEEISGASSHEQKTIHSAHQKDVKTPNPAWSKPVGLINEIQALYRNPMTASWAHSTVQIIESLENLNGLSDPNALVVFDQLANQINQLDFLTIQLSTEPVESANKAQGRIATQLRQIRYSIQRRLQIWPVVHELSKRPTQRIGSIEDHHVGQFLLASKSKLNIDGMEKGWAEYLKLAQAADTFNSLNPHPYEKKKAARSVLARLYSPSLNTTQRQYLGSAIDNETIEILRISSTDQVNLQQFLKRLEKVEHNPNGASKFYLNDSYQSLLWSHDPAYHTLASRLQTHYRNANFRVSVSEQLLNRLVPQMPETREPYRDRILGADVIGQNRISNSTRVTLVPDPDKISMKLETFGKVNSRTTATRSGIVVENEGTSRFRIIKRLAFGQQGIFAYRPETTSQVAQRIVGLRSNLDNIPPLGWVARRIAKNRIEEQAPVTKRYAQHQLETKAEDKFNKEIDQTLDELEANLTRNLLHPLIAMDLEPDPVETSTTSDRINMRYRLAGRDQMAANTARPRGVKDCLLSMQIHESAINNTLNRFELAGKKFTTEELINYINQTFGDGFVVANKAATRKPARFEFAPFDPIRIQFEDHQVSITINLKSFQIGKSKRWRNLVLKSTYNPQIESGFVVGMYQGKEGLSIKGKRLNVGDQLAIGVICEVLFPEDFQMALIPSGIANQLKISNGQASQFVVSNGWIGLSIDEPVSNRIYQNTNQAQRVPSNRQR